MKRIVLLPLLACVGSFGIIAWRSHRQDQNPIRTTGANIPNAAAAGNPEEAERRAHLLLDVLRDNDWQVPRPVPTEVAELLRLPDRHLAEGKINRLSPWSFAIVDKNSPNAKDVALYTSVYARQNRSYFRGDNSNAKPSGFYIVGYKNGVVRRIPASQVRSTPGRDGDYDCFPDTSCYSTSTPHPFYGGK